MTKMLAALLFSTLATGCVFDSSEMDTTLTQPIASRCELLEGRTFRSGPQSDCGPRPAGESSECTWHVRFETRDATSSTFLLHVSDTGESGDVQCIDAGGAIDIVDSFDNVRATYDPNEDRITWSGVVYDAQ